MSFNSKTTLVTGIWDLGRNSLSEDWSRSFDHYKNHFDSLLRNLEDINLIIFVDKDLEDFVWQRRSRSNTALYHHGNLDFTNNFFPFFNQIQEIRSKPEWYNQAAWLKDSTQAKMEWYNPMVMSKPFLLHNAKVFDPFDSDYMFWIDGGISNTVHLGYFYHDMVLEKITSVLDKLLFICFPYEAENEIHGFDYEAINQYCSTKVDMVARGGFFGGKKELLSKFNNIYYNLLSDTLNSGYMGTEESIFTIIAYLYPDLFEHDLIESDGLISTFFENVKNNKSQIQIKYNNKPKLHENNNVALYINAFNSPPQLQMLLDSIEKYEPKLLSRTEKILIDNSTKENLYPEYDRIAKEYDFNIVRQGNLGICRSRQFCAEHFYESKNKYMLFFEDDMLIDLEFNNCNFGFNKHIDHLYDIIIGIMDNYDYDFLKLSFSEFYGHNGLQWSWHNVPHTKRLEYFGSIKEKPFTIFNNIKSHNGVPFADGEVYYSNWPHIINQLGNKKMFLDTKWEYPYEQTWMSHFYTLTREKLLKPAILLASPITHNRVYHYEQEERKEN
jgi:hypothetical protein